MKKKLIVLSGFVLGLAPVMVLAQQTPPSFARCSSAQTGTLYSMLCVIGNVLNAVVPILIALGVVYFVWGVVTYVISNDEEAKEKGRNRIIFGIIGLAIIIGLWGLVNILGRTFGIGSTQNTNVIMFPGVAF
ncbi:hypothetical protein A2906_00120 [Candidatus Nomurabacteria bacterium RIFCSPLOWO2_01_FULL_37_25]|nr:MAG: hypothetical protein A2640_00360 [Candidatus Nomurabacteria bacterium RIFCSPHIGHO2_01_FULL_36_23]OGI88502.1 MAG: hypothetical protein A2906_00120 [Candidatus Nomurabacteria bacterium RIFCSPLOWO2_01_FULL_37_25]